MTSGRVLGVEEQWDGSSVSANASIGATTLTLDDVSDFDEDGGTLRAVAAASNSIHTYSNVNDDANTLSISPGLGVALTAGDRVNPEPSAITRYAMVGLEDADDTTLLARVPHALFRHMPSGIRQEDDREPVTLHEESPGSWVVGDLLGRSRARFGLAETDWRNANDVPIIGGDLESGTDYALFGTALTGMDLFGFRGGPDDMSGGQSIPAGSSGSVRQLGESGIFSGAIALTTYIPLKITASGVASVMNQNNSVGWNVRFYLMCVDVGSGTVMLGRQGTQWCAAADAANGSHRQVTNERQLFIDAADDNPRTLNWWWGFQNDTGTSKPATIRNAKMTLRLAYAPDIPTAAFPERSPAWARSADMKNRYLQLEGNDVP